MHLRSWLNLSLFNIISNLVPHKRYFIFFAPNALFLCQPVIVFVSSISSIFLLVQSICHGFKYRLWQGLVLTFENSSNRLLGTLVGLTHHVCSIMDDEDLFTYIHIKVCGPDNDIILSPTDFCSLPSSTSLKPSSLPPPKNSTEDYKNIYLEENLRIQRIQDSGSSLDRIPKTLKTINNSTNYICNDKYNNPCYLGEH